MTRRARRSTWVAESHAHVLKQGLQRAEDNVFCALSRCLRLLTADKTYSLETGFLALFPLAVLVSSKDPPSFSAPHSLHAQAKEKSQLLQSKPSFCPLLIITPVFPALQQLPQGESI